MIPQVSSVHNRLINKDNIDESRCLDNSSICRGRVNPVGTAVVDDITWNVHICRQCDVRIFTSGNRAWQLPTTHPDARLGTGEVEDMQDYVANVCHLLGAKRAPAFVAALKKVLTAVWLQEKKWGEQLHSPSIWHAILSEEMGEFAEAILEWRMAYSDNLCNIVVDLDTAENPDEPRNAGSPSAKAMDVDLNFEYAKQLGETGSALKWRDGMVLESAQIGAVVLAWLSSALDPDIALSPAMNTTRKRREI